MKFIGTRERGLKSNHRTEHEYFLPFVASRELQAVSDAEEGHFTSAHLQYVFLIVLTAHSLQDLTDIISINTPFIFVRSLTLLFTTGTRFLQDGARCVLLGLRGAKFQTQHREGAVPV